MSAALPGAVAPRRRHLVIGNMAWLLSDKAFALVMGLMVSGLIARHEGPVGSGHFAYGAALLQIGLALSMVCAGAAVLPRWCRQRRASAGALANVFALRLVASLLTALAMLVFCALTVPDAQRRAVAMVMVCAVPLIEPFYVIATYWLSRNQNRPTTTARASGLLARGALVALGLSWGVPMTLLALAWVVEAGINAGVQTLQARREFAGARWRHRVRWLRVRAYLRFGLRFVPAVWLGAIFLRADRLVLAHRMPAADYGLYAAPMQLVEVWAQVAYLICSSLATAHLYRRVRSQGQAQGFFFTAVAMAGVGLLGLLGVWLFGPALLRLVFGAAFEGSFRFFVAGAAFAVLLFADQAVEMFFMANDQPAMLVMKWAAALAVALLVFDFGLAQFGALVGPLGLASGLVAGWGVLGCVVLAGRRRAQGSEQERPPQGAAASP